MNRFWTLVILGLIALPIVAVGKSVETTSGIIYNRNGQFEEARVILLKALAKDPNDWEAHFQIGYSYSKLDSVELAYAHFMRVKELEPKKAKDATDNIASNYARHYKDAQVAFSREDLPAAAAEFKLATLADPTQSTAHYNLAVVYSRLSANDPAYRAQALGEADKVLELSTPKDPNYMRALQLAMRQLVALEREGETVDRIRHFIDEDPSNYQVVQDMGMEFLEQKKWTSAAVFLSMAAEARTKVGAEEDFDTYLSLGVAQYNRRGEDPAAIDEALAAYDKALSIRPDDPTAAFNALAACMAKQDWAGAAERGEKYASVSPDDPKGWQLLARAYSELGEGDKASEALERYKQLKGE